MQNEQLLERIRDTVIGIFDEHKIELVDLICRREGKVKVLRILADTEAGITVDECAKMNEIISAVLDKEDFIDENYILEISSPGLDRPLKTKQDYLRMKGKRIRVYTFAPIDAKKEFIGALETVDENDIVISNSDARLTKIPLNKISKATLDYKSLI